jgi:hypothetical protein
MSTLEVETEEETTELEEAAPVTVTFSFRGEKMTAQQYKDEVSKLQVLV